MRIDLPVAGAEAVRTDEDERARELAALHARILACRACERAGDVAEARPVRHPWTPRQRTLVVGQAPGAQTHARRYHFAGPGGKLLERWFAAAGFEPGTWRDRCYITALTRCFPGKNPRGNGDRRPSPAELSRCRPFLDAELALVPAGAIVPVGTMAIEFFLGRRPLDAVVGRTFDLNGRRVIPLPHPSGVSRWLNDAANQRLVERAVEHLAAARVELGL
ncbi:MAG: uracil-DNA glycosylase [Chloroflexota bacterium]|nr:uracil-DNA glycosylase [Chloroflexota bacterium]